MLVENVKILLFIIFVTVNSGFEEVRVADENNSMSLIEPQLNNTQNNSETNVTEKILQKRSDVSDAANNHQNKGKKRKKKITAFR